MSVSFKTDDVTLLHDWKKEHGLDYAATVRLGLQMLRRMERHAAEGYTKLIMRNQRGEELHVDYLSEIIPHEKKQ